MGKSSILIQLLFALFLVLLAGCSQGAKLPRLADDGVVLAFGDSITAGSGAGAGESYPEILGGLIGRRVVNAGVPGEVTAEGAARLPELLESVRPSLLILCHGGNDLLRHMDQRQAAENLRGMIRMARERGVAVVLIAVPSPDLSLKPPAFYGELAAQSGLPIESKALGKILGKGSLKSDYIHPNAAGYRKLAEALAALLKKSGAI
ncbi:MAG: GDSL-type esterase/lipase family protein [Geobacteraceae bacterium]|nr:GDSL-type esterase/lipase family protein [Geobacteraceae bacterium]